VSILKLELGANEIIMPWVVTTARAESPVRIFSPAKTALLEGEGLPSIVTAPTVSKDPIASDAIMLAGNTKSSTQQQIFTHDGDI
jgi:hypothetical protein